MNVWIDVAVIAGMFAVGNILFGHFEEHTPKWRRILKLFIVTGLVALISSTAGRIWSVALVGTMFAVVLYLHGMVAAEETRHQRLDRRAEGQNYALRGWKV